MATGIIIGVIIFICIFSVKSYMKKLAHGCCGTGGDNKKTENHKTDLSECRYEYTISIEGMSCNKCAARIEKAFNKHGKYAQVDFKKGIAEIYSKNPVSEFSIRQIIGGLGYFVKNTEAKEL